MGSGEVGEKDCYWKHLGLSLNNHNTNTRQLINREISCSTLKANLIARKPVKLSELIN